MTRPTVRSSIVSDYARYARARGLDPLEMVRTVGLPARCLTQPDLLLRVGKVNRLLELSAAASRTPDFGLQLSKARRLSSLGALGALMRDEPSVRDAIRRSITGAHLNSSAFWMHLHEHGDVALLRTAVDADGAPVIRQATELAVGGLFRVLQQLLGSQWTPREVRFIHAPAATGGASGRFFGCPVRYSSEFDGLVLDTADLDQPIPLSDERLRRYAGLAMSETPSPGHRITARMVKQRILASMPDGRCSNAAIAASLGMDRRTLHRHLQAEGASFSRVHDEVRLELAQRYLAAGRQEVSQIAELLAFNSLSAFSRWFKQQTGRAPSRWAGAAGSTAARSTTRGVRTTGRPGTRDRPG